MYLPHYCYWTEGAKWLNIGNPGRRQQQQEKLIFKHIRKKNTISYCLLRFFLFFFFCCFFTCLSFLSFIYYYFFVSYFITSLFDSSMNKLKIAIVIESWWLGSHKETKNLQQDCMNEKITENLVENLYKKWVLKVASKFYTKKKTISICLPHIFTTYSLSSSFATRRMKMEIDYSHAASMLLSIWLGLKVRKPYVPYVDHITIYNIDIQLNFLQYDLIAVVIVTIYYKKYKKGE